METRTSRSPDAGTILGLLGGVLLIIGSLLTWATVSVNVANIAGAFGVDPSTLPAGTFPAPQHFAGTKLSDGKIALACGVIALLASLLVMMGMARKVMAVILLLGGLAGGGIALYDGLTGKQSAIDAGVKNLSALGLPGDVKSFFNVAIGIGIWVCVAGGIMAAIAGIMALNRKTPAVMEMQASAPVDMGAGVPLAAPETSVGMPAPDMPPVPPTPPMDAPGAGSAPPAI